MWRIGVLCVALLFAAAAAGSASTVPVFCGCTSKTSVRPAGVVFACADANFYATSIRWTRWDAHAATGAGTGHQNDCTPNSAAGRFHAYPLAIGLSKPRVCSGTDEFSTISWRFVRGKPAGVPRTGSESFSCRFRRERP